jgi:hypothetical protein
MPARQNQDTPVSARCSFCRKPSAAVDKLVAGPGVFICNECIDLASQIIAETVVPAQSRVAPWERPATVEEILASLRPVAAAQTHAQENLRAWVARARSLGAPWAQVGTALGITRQSAWERYSSDE